MKYRVLASIAVIAILAAVLFLSNDNTNKAPPPVTDDAALKSLSIN